jgi:hypothetical protein
MLQRINEVNSSDRVVGFDELLIPNYPLFAEKLIRFNLSIVTFSASPLIADHSAFTRSALKIPPSGAPNGGREFNTHIKELILVPRISC